MSNKNIHVRVIDATIIAGNHAEAGTIHELDPGEAHQVMGAGRAVRATEEEIAEAAAPKAKVEKASKKSKAEKASATPAASDDQPAE